MPGVVPVSLQRWEQHRRGCRVGPQPGLRQQPGVVEGEFDQGFRGELPGDRTGRAGEERVQHGLAQVGGGRSQVRAPGDQFAHGQPEQVLNQERTESRPAGVTGGGPGQGAPAAKPFVRPQGLVEGATPETVELLGPEMG